MHTYLMATIAYIQENGDELERARLAGLLGRSRAEPKVARSLLARQNEDGGFPYGLIQGRPSAITATATAMQWMHHLRLLPSSYVERATGYLLTVQRPDGAWEESPAVLRFDPPTVHAWRADSPGFSRWNGPTEGGAATMAQTGTWTSRCGHPACCSRTVSRPRSLP